MLQCFSLVLMQFVSWQHRVVKYSSNFAKFHARFSSGLTKNQLIIRDIANVSYFLTNISLKFAGHFINVRSISQPIVLQMRLATQASWSTNKNRLYFYSIYIKHRILLPPNWRLNMRELIDPKLCQNCLNYFTETGSPTFDEFLELLGQKIRLRGWDNYRGGLDVKGKN